METPESEDMKYEVEKEYQKIQDDSTLNSIDKEQKLTEKQEKINHYDNLIYRYKDKCYVFMINDEFKYHTDYFLDYIVLPYIN